MDVIQERAFAGRTIPDLLAERVSAHPERIFLSFEDSRYSYGDFIAHTGGWIDAYRAIGLSKGDRVAIHMHNRPEWLFAWAAAMYLGLVEVGVNTNYRGASLGRLIALSSARLIVVDEPNLQRLVELEPGSIPSVEVIAHVDATSEALPVDGIRNISFADIDAVNSVPVPVEVDPTDLAKLVFTSGTTGPAKAVALSHGYCVDFSTEWVRNLRYRQDDVLYTCFPLFHASAALEAVLSAILLGASVGLGRRFSASNFWADIRRTGGTVMTLLGAAMTILWKQEPRPDDAENTIRQILAAPRPPMTREFEERFGLKIVECYGATEVAHPVFQPMDDDRPGFAGRLVGHHDVMIADENDHPLPAGERGQILVRPRGANEMMSGYFGNDEATVKAWKNLWYHTGDLGSLTEDGWLTWHGRMGDRLRVKGHQISAVEVEDVLVEHPEVAVAAAIGVPSELSDDEIKVLIVRQPGSALSPRELVEWSWAHLADYMVPRYVEMVEDLPRSPTQKVQKSELLNNWQTPGTEDVLGDGPRRRPDRR